MARILAVTMVLALLPSDLVAGGPGTAVVRGAARGLTRKVLGRSASGVAAPKAWSARTHRSVKDILRLDRLRDARTQAIRLTKPRKVHRYTSLRQINLYKKQGIPPGTHFTSHARPGRPPSPSVAKKQYGLPRKPHARVTVEIPAGTQVKHNKVIGGRRGAGEILLRYRHLPPSSVKADTRLK